MPGSPPEGKHIYNWKNSAKADQALTTNRFFQLPGVYHPSELAQLLAGTAINLPAEPIGVSAVVDSGRHNQPGSIFVAYPGVTVDGHEYIEQAFENGSVAAVVSDASKLCGKPGIVVGDGRKALSFLAALFSDDPSKELITLGVTGTNGKSTIHWLLYHLLCELGYPGIRIGTLGIFAENIVDESSTITTPSSIKIHSVLKRIKEAGLKSCAIETSSHGLDQNRVDHLYFDVGIYTNLTRDHLDYHGDMETYFLAKTRLFDLLNRNKSRRGGAVINIDCPYGERIVQDYISPEVDLITYGENTKAVLRIVGFSQNFEASKLEFCFNGRDYSVATKFLGKHNASNISAAFAACVSLGFEPEIVLKAFGKIPGVPGRLEPVGTRDVAVFVDYAHTPDALSSTLGSIRELAKKDFWVIFGCGGDRDRGKRPLMAEAVCNFADKVVVTSDNPRTENPEQIISDILSEDCKAEIIEVDRKVAIEKTLRRVKKGDVVVIAGKGHENYQIIGKDKIHFSDQEEVMKLKSQGVLSRWN